MPRSDPAQSRAAFTLIELVIVMCVLAFITALAVPLLSGSVHHRNLLDEATRFVALTEYARDEAVSQGVPMTVWIDPDTQHFGVSAKTGYDGDASREREYELNPDIHFEIEKATANGNLLQPVEFGPDGAPGVSASESLKLVDRFNAVVTIARTKDGWSYEIQKEAK
jgi:type II secretion system protein H